MSAADFPLPPTATRVERSTAVESYAGIAIRVAFGRFAAACAWLLPLGAFACPVCNTETGRQVRAGIFGEDFWSTLAAVLSPFPVLLLVLAGLHFGWPRFGNHHPTSAQPTPQTNDRTP